MSAVLTVLSMGLVLGVQHATDADHVVAVSTVVARERRPRSAARIGALWGLGHSATVLLVGGAMVATGIVIPDRAARALELGVAAMLVVLGVLGVRRALAARRDAAHRRVRVGDGHGHHAHATHGASRRSIRPIAVGVVHGLAGSAAIALAVLTTVRDRATALGYLATFCVGTIVGMSLVTALLSTPLALASRRVDARWLGFAGAIAGVTSIGLGLWMSYEIGIADGLLVGLARAATP